MIAILPQSQPTIVLGDASAVSIPVTNPPAWLGQLAPGSVVQGTVQGTDPNGAVTIQTGNGPLTLAGPANLPPGASVTLELQPTTQPQVSITSLLPPPPPSTYDGTVSTNLPPPAISSTQLPSPGDIVTAQVERGAPASIATIPAPPAALAVISDVFPVVTTLGSGVAQPPPAPLPLAAVGLPLGGQPATPRPIPQLVPATLLVQELATGSPGTAAAQPQPGATTPQTTTSAAQPLAGQTTAATAALAAKLAAGTASLPGTPSATTPGTQTATQVAAAALTPEPPSLVPDTTAVPKALLTATAGQRITVQIVSITPPGGTPAPVTGTVAPPALGQPGPAVPPAATVTAEILTGTPQPTAGAATPSLTTAPPTVTGTVVGANAAGQPILSAGPLLLTLDTAAPPPGTQIALAWAIGETMRPTTTASTLSGEVAATAELIQASQGTAAQAIVAAVVPTVGPALAEQMAYFVTAVQAGDIKNWLGDSPRSILDRTTRGKAALDSLSKEFGKVDDAASTAAPGGWRGMTIPMLNGGMVEPVRLYLHGTNPDDENAGEGDGKKKGGDNRFLLDIQLTHLGHFQIDGFVRSDRLDLMIRTPEALDHELKRGIEQVFINTTSARGLAGLVVFQVSPPIVPEVTGSTPAKLPGILV